MDLPELLKRARSLDLVGGLSLLLLLMALASWASGIAHRAFDYDELEHAHVVWLISAGDRPFRDFFECHPPFLWYPLALLFRVAGDRYALLFACRVATAIGHLLFLLYVLANLSLSFRRLPRPPTRPARTCCLAALVIVAHPAVTHYLLEFRLDAWPNALLLFAIYRYRQGRPGVFRSAMVFGCLSAAAAICSPKLGLFQGLFVASSIALEERRLPRLAGMATGAALCVAAAVLVLLALRLDPLDVYHLSITYHEMFNAMGGFGYGLAAGVLAQPVLLAIVAAGIASWCSLARARALASPFELSVLGFLALQLLLVSISYKQYSGPWFLLGIVFVPYVELRVARARVLRALVVGLGIVYAGSNAAEGLRDFARTRGAESDIEFREWVEGQVPPDGIVAASMEMLPTFRRNPFYHLATSFAPSGFDTATIIQAMKRQPYGRKLTEQGYREDVEARPPSLIVLNGWFTPLQREALKAYLEEHRDRYRQAQSPRGPVLIRTR